MNNPKDDNDQNMQPIDPFSEFYLETYQALLEDRTILLNGEITDKVIEKIVLPLNVLSHKNNKPIKLLIHSPGGNVEAGQAVVDAILTSSAPVIGVVLGQAMSAAFDIYLATDRRILYPNSILMCHSGSAAMQSQTLPAINIEADLHKKYFLNWSKFYASRTNISETNWMTLLSSGLNQYWLPTEALKDGLAHEVVKIPKKNLKSLKKSNW